MPLDPRAKRFLDTLAAMNPPSALSLTVDERRNALQHLLSFSGPPEALGAVEDRTLPGAEGPLTIRIYTPAAGRSALRKNRAITRAEVVERIFRTISDSGTA